MFVDFIIERFKECGSKCAIISNDKKYTYDDLINIYNNISIKLADIQEGQVVSLESDFSPVSAMMLLALIERGSIIIPIAESSKEKAEQFQRVGEVEKMITISSDEKINIKRTQVTSQHELYRYLRDKKRPGLVLFSSGSTGISKGTVHDFSLLLEKFKAKRKASCMITFLLFDHIGGLNTLLHSFSNGGVVVVVRNRNVDTVLSAIEKYKVEVLPTSPTFLNLIIVSEAYRKYDLSSLTLITYGTEIMNEYTLKRIYEIMPNVKFLQTYGLSEVGIMKTKSESSNSLWIKVGGAGYETRIVDGMLEIKAHSTMLGYLNAPSPFTEDGWFKTGDAVEQKGDYIKILGRKSEIINVGGQKVYPAEVEAVIIEMNQVKDVIVKGEPHILTGNIVTAKVILNEDIHEKDFRKMMQLFCKDKLETYKIPKKVTIIKQDLYSERFKKIRN